MGDRRRLGPSFTWRLFDFARIDAQIDSARGGRAAALADYRKTVLAATQDVEAATAELAGAAAAATPLERAAAALARNRDLARLAYEGGAASFLQVLDAQSRLNEVEDAAILARADTALAAIRLYAALGGGWSEADLQTALARADAIRRGA